MGEAGHLCPGPDSRADCCGAWDQSSVSSMVRMCPFADQTVSPGKHVPVVVPPSLRRRDLKGWFVAGESGGLLGSCVCIGNSLTLPGLFVYLEGLWRPWRWVR